MQFVTGGPDVPERLIQAHEEGHVVFFCGAGISYPAGLPGFDGLVKRVYAAMGDEANDLERTAVKAGKYDLAIALLEARIAPKGHGRELVRRAVSHILTPAAVSLKSTATHAALLTLARGRDERTRIVTTNFDRLFEEVVTRDSLTLRRFHAPMLPVPKNRWDGLVYLHGLLTPTPSTSDLDQLVLASGDFGLAYLTERWAARFVGELFRNFAVCFVGYSINDPVLRYMMDALAADRLLGESPPEMFAFGSHKKGDEREQEAEWRAKNVTPILYRQHERHAYLHRTLNAWAATYRDGVGGKEQIIVQHAHLHPQNSTRQEDFVGRVLWALSDGSGLPARRFAETVPTPSFDWVECFAEQCFDRDDLARFGVAPLPVRLENQFLARYGVTRLKFSLLYRPAPYLRAPYMALVRREREESSPDDVMSALAHWLLRYLDEPKLIVWLAKRGGDLSDVLVHLIERRLNEIGKWERGSNAAALNELRRRSPQAIPRATLRPLWRLLLTGRVRNTAPSFDLYKWFDRFGRDGLTATLRLELRDLLAPRIVMREPFNWVAPEAKEEKEKEEETAAEGDGDGTTPERLKALVDWDLVLACAHVHSALRDRRTSDWQKALPALLDDATTLLRDALDLMAELNAANAQVDQSYLQQPSISEHAQNRDFHDWTALIDLNRDAWLATAARDAEGARLVATRWWTVDYPIFRRLAFFAAAHGRLIPDEQIQTWLLTDDGWWLWSVETRRETFRLLVALAPRLDEALLGPLEAAVLAGPPRQMFRADVEVDEWTRLVEREVWLRLAKMQAAGAPLGNAARSRLHALSAGHPEWQLAADARDEFPFWMETGGWSGQGAQPTPLRRRELMQWLRLHPEEEGFTGDDWADRCRNDFPTTACALCGLAREGFWPTSRWQRALQAWSEAGKETRSWRYIAPILLTSPNIVIDRLAHALSWWLQRIAKVFDRREDAFFALCERVLNLDYGTEEETDVPVTRALNHPVGHVTQALLDWWYGRRKLQNDQGLPPEIEPIFTRLCDIQRKLFQHGRVLLSAHAINLFLVDPNWTSHNLLPLFEWQRSRKEARGVWEGFLWSPRLVRPYLAATRGALLETARHYSDLGEHGRQYAGFLTFVALDRGDTFTVEELRRAFHSLPPPALAEAASALARAMEGAGEQRESYWTNRVAPFWKEIWPKSAASPAIADDLFRISVAAGSEFAAALNATSAWLMPVPHPDYLVHMLLESGQCKHFPEASLEWLNLLIDGQPWAPSNLRECLKTIGEASTELLEDRRYRRLDDFYRQRGV